MKHKTEISAGGIVYKKKGDQTVWLVTQHSQHKGWGFPKGLIGDNSRDEKKEEAALREVKEEGGVMVKIIDPNPICVQYIYTLKDTTVHKTVYYFLMEYVSGDPKDHDWEMLDAKFLTEYEVIKILTFKSDKEAFEKILRAGEGNCPDAVYDPPSCGE